MSFGLGGSGNSRGGGRIRGGRGGGGGGKGGLRWPATRSFGGDDG